PAWLAPGRNSGRKISATSKLSSVPARRGPDATCPSQVYVTIRDLLALTLWGFWSAVAWHRFGILEAADFQKNPKAASSRRTPKALAARRMGGTLDPSRLRTLASIQEIRS